MAVSSTGDHQNHGAFNTTKSESNDWIGGTTWLGFPMINHPAMGICPWRAGKLHIHWNGSFHQKIHPALAWGSPWLSKPSSHPKEPQPPRLPAPKRKPSSSSAPGDFCWGISIGKQSRWAKSERKISWDLLWFGLASAKASVISWWSFDALESIFATSIVVGVSHLLGSNGS